MIKTHSKIGIKCKIGLTFEKVINVDHYINRIKEKDIIILIKAEQTSDTI